MWQDFKGKVDDLTGKYVPTKTLRGRKNLPWVTQEIRRKMNQSDHLYQVQKFSLNDNARECFKKAKYEVECMLRTSYHNDLIILVGAIDDSLSDSSSHPDNKKVVFLPKKLQVVHL